MQWPVESWPRQPLTALRHRHLCSGDPGGNWRRYSRQGLRRPQPTTLFHKSAACCHTCGDRLRHRRLHYTVSAPWELAAVVLLTVAVVQPLLPGRHVARVQAAVSAGELTALQDFWNITGFSASLSWGGGDPCADAWTGVTCTTGAPPVTVT